MLSVGNFFGHLHPSTKELSPDVLDKTTELVFSFRDGVESVCWITNDKDVFKSVAGEVPDIIYNVNTDRYAVDLDSIGTSQVRRYVGSNNINLFKPNGQFGTRLRGGKDAASERYIFTQLNKLNGFININSSLNKNNELKHH